MDATIWKRLSENVDFVLSFDESKHEGEEEESLKLEFDFSKFIKEEVKEIPKKEKIVVKEEKK